MVPGFLEVAQHQFVSLHALTKSTAKARAHYLLTWILYGF